MKEYASSTVSYTTTMTYDATGNLLTVVDAKTIAQATTAMTYDTLGRQTAITYLLGTTVVASESATYDLAGRPLTRVDKSGVTTTTEYDAAGRVWAVKNPSETVYYFRDAMGRTQMLDGAYDITYTYNFRGWVTGMQRTMGLTKTVTIGYNAAGVMSSITYPNTAQVTYAFDTYGRPNNVKLNGTTVWSGTYFPDDRLNTETLADSTVVTYNYDTRDRLDTATSTRLSLDYHYDAVGNVDGLVSSSGGTESYAYDYLGRMTSASGAWGSISYTYDEVGNRKTKVEGGVTTTYSYDTNGMNMVTGDTTPWTYLYDSNGQMTWRTGSSAKYNYIWNNLGQLTQVDKSTLKSGKWTTTTVASYYYSADGTRLYAFDGPGFTPPVTYKTYYYVGQELWVEMSSVSGDLSAATYKYYIYVGGDLKAVWAANEGKVYCYYNDALGSTWQVWTAGAKKATFSVVSYKPFGIPYTPTGTETVKFAGELLDTATAPSGLYYLRARYMDPELGRFISMDPKMGSLSFSQTLNRYVYCINNPLRFTDPTGKFIPLVAAAIGAATGFLVSTLLYGAEVALTDTEWDWEEYAVEAVAGTVAGAIGGLLMNPGAGLAAKAGMKAALMGTKIAAKAGLKVTTKVMERVVAGSLTGLVTGPASYLSKGGLNTARGVDPQLTWSGLGRSALLGALGGGMGSYVGGKVGDRLGKYIDLGASRLGVQDSLSNYGVTGTVIGGQLASKMTSGGLSKIAASIDASVSQVSVASEIPAYSS